MPSVVVHLSPKLDIVGVTSPNIMDSEVELDKENQRIWCQKIAKCPNAIQASMVGRKISPN